MHVWSDLFFIIKATCNSCACFGWDTLACIEAIGTRDVSSEWMSKYAFDLERSSISTSTKTGVQKVKCSFLSRGAAFGSGIHKSNVFLKAIQLWKRLSCLFDWQQLLVHEPIQLILYFLLSWQHINFDCLCYQLFVHNSLQCLRVVNLEGTKYQQNCQ